LSSQQKESVSALSTLTSGIAAGVSGDSRASALTGAQAGKNAVENNFLSVSEKSALEKAKHIVKSSKDPVERDKAQQKVDELIELDISRDKKVIDACGNGQAASAGCANARLEVIETKQEYTSTGNYNSKASQQYSDAYGQILNLLKITSVNAQNQQQVKDALVQYAIDVKGVDRQTAQKYAETKHGIDIIVASVTPVLGSAAASRLGNIGKHAALQTSIAGKPIKFDGEFYSVDNLKFSKNYYEKLWSQGRPAPFIQAKEVLSSNPKIQADPRGAPGYFRYGGSGLEMIYNPTTGQVGHIQPIKIK
ncbi:VENN motif pre-toxin domain-containing protein, partial [Martelella alba]